MALNVFIIQAMQEGPGLKAGVIVAAENRDEAWQLSGEQKDSGMTCRYFGISAPGTKKGITLKGEFL